MILREVDLQVMENDPNWREGILQPEMLVAGTKSGGKDACQVSYRYKVTYYRTCIRISLNTLLEFIVYLKNTSHL